jgi:hypothetical protein
MTQVIVRYKVKPERAAENEELVRAVYAELHQTRPEGLHYATFQHDDGVTFVHLAVHDTQDGSNPLSSLPAFRRFQEHIGDRCDEGPVVGSLRQIGAYRLFDEEGTPQP